MSTPALHRMDCEFSLERQTMRYHCPICERCVEDGPEGLRVLHKGDLLATHRGGVFAVEHEDIEPEPPTPPRWH